MKTPAVVIIFLATAAGLARADAPTTAPAAPTSAPAPAPATAPALPVFSSDTVNVRFSYPGSLTKFDSPDPNAVVMFRHLGDPQGEIHLQVNANGKPLPDAALVQVVMGMAALVKHQNGTVLGQTDAKLGSAPAVKLEFSLPSGSKMVNICAVTAIYDGKIYSLAAAAPPASFDQFLALVQPMYDTFQFTQPIKK